MPKALRRKEKTQKNSNLDKGDKGDSGDYRVVPDSPQG